LIAERDSHNLIAPTLRRQFVDFLSTKLNPESLLVIVVEHAEWIDDPSAALLEHLGLFAADKPLALVVTYRPVQIIDSNPSRTHPLLQVRSELLQENTAINLTLDGLGVDAMTDVLSYARGIKADRAFARWLCDFTGGNPMFAIHVFDVVRDDLIVDANGLTGLPPTELAEAFDAIELPGAISAAMEAALQRLEIQDRDLLRVAAVEGFEFLTPVIGEVTQENSAALLERLGRVAGQHGFIRYARQVPLGQPAFVYQFEHRLLQHHFYESLSEPQRILYHASIAQSLLKTYGSQPTRTALIEIARHLRLGGEPYAAAEQLLVAAGTARLDGAAPEAISIARYALSLIEKADGSDSTHQMMVSRLRAELILMLLGSYDLHGLPDNVGELSPEDMADEARSAAVVSCDLTLEARALHAAGNIAVTRGDVEAAEALLNSALDRSQASGDQIVQLTIMMDLGNLLDITSLDRGREMLRDAEVVITNQLAANPTDRELCRLKHGLEGLIGIAEFDAGDFGQAISLLDRSIEGFESMRQIFELPRWLNYRAQVALGSGDFDAARSYLDRALEIGGVADESPLLAYNRSLRGKVDLDAGEIEQAEPVIRAAYEELERRQIVAFALIAGSYLAECWLRSAFNPAKCRAEALPLIDRLLETAIRGKFVYFEVWALSLRSTALWQAGRFGEALTDSDRAVDCLERHGGQLPIVRSEEVFLQYSHCLEGVGKVKEAKVWRTRARAMLERKAGTLPAGHSGCRFERTPAGRELLCLGGSFDTPEPG
jgi:tetratricopeptide (TPR) repeat protein